MILRWRDMRNNMNYTSPFKIYNKISMCKEKCTPDQRISEYPFKIFSDVPLPIWLSLHIYSVTTFYSILEDVAYNF